LEEAAPGLFGLGDGAPYDALVLAKRTPSRGDGAESRLDCALIGGAGVKCNECWVANLAIAIALSDGLAAFARFGIWHFHN
jgi:hypothetical protein